MAPLHATPVVPTLDRNEPARSFLGRLLRGRRVIRYDADWPGFAGPAWERHVMAEPVTDRFHAKQGRSIGRWTLTRPDGGRLVVYLKRHYILPRRHGLLAALVPGRAWSPGLEEYENLAWAKANGLPVPRAAAVGELLGPWGMLQSFLAVEELTDMLPLHEAIPLAERGLSPAAFAGWKRGLVAELARLARELHRRRAYHKDLYLCHFYIAECDTTLTPGAWRGRVVMIDFHRLGRHRLGWHWWAAKDLAQFGYSSDVPGVTARDRLRFWKLYRSGDWSPAGPPPRWLAALVRWKWRLYDRQHARRAARKERAA